MGLFSKIGKAVKGVFKGVSKVFKAVTKPVVKGLQKVLGKKLTKALLLGAAIFTGGTALIAGAQTFASTAGGFFTKFVAGGKEFLAALAHPIKGAKSILPGGGSLTGPGGALTATGAVGPGSVASSPLGQNPGEFIPAPTGGAGAGLEAGALATEGLPAAEIGAAPALGALPGTTLPAGVLAEGGSSGGLLSRAAGTAKGIGSGIAKFASSPGGGYLLGGMLAGLGEAQGQKALLKQQNKYNVPYTDEQMSMMRPAVNASPGYLTRAQQIMDMLSTRPLGSAPVAVGTPEYVASLARGGQ